MQPLVHRTLAKLQKRAARIILQTEFNTPSAFMFEKLDWLSVADRLNFNKAVLIYRALDSQTPEYISKLLKPMSELANVRKRLFIRTKARTSLYNGSFSCSAPRL